MKVITIDCNSDKVIINDGTEIPIPRTMRDVQSLVYELINAIYNEPDVELHRVDEDTRKRIERW